MTMKNKYLYNQKNKEYLLEDLKKEPFKRVTLSFYKYIPLNALKELRDSLFSEWNDYFYDIFKEQIFDLITGSRVTVCKFVSFSYQYFFMTN